MPIEDDYGDVLQNIKYAIVTAHRENSALTDKHVLAALDVLTQDYTHERQNRDPKPPRLSEASLQVYHRIRDMCEWRLGRESGLPEFVKQAKPDPLTLREIVACLKRIKSSVQLWHKERGVRGYLTFIKQHID